MEYHDIFIPFKDKIYLKQGSNISLLLDFNVISSCRRATRNFSRQGRFRGTREIRKTFSQKYTKKKTPLGKRGFFSYILLKPHFKWKISPKDAHKQGLFSQNRVHFLIFLKDRGRFATFLAIIAHLLCLTEAKVYTVKSDLTNFIDVQCLHENLTFSLVQQLVSSLPRIRSRQYWFISSGKSVLPIKLSTAYPQEKSSQKKNYAYLTDSEYFTCL